MTYHPCQFLIVEPVTDASGDCHRITLVIYSAGKGIQHGVIYDVDLGHGHATSHGEILHDIIYARILSALQGTGTRGTTHHTGIHEIGYEKPQPHNAHHPGKYVHHLIVDIRPVDLTGFAIGRIRDAQHVDYDEKHIYDTQQDTGKKEQEQQGLHIIGSLLRMYADVFHQPTKICLYIYNGKEWMTYQNFTSGALS